MEKLIDEIIALEWEDFQNVHNDGGRASCQDDKPNFMANRKSQFLTWSREATESYLNDLKRARAAGRNLLTEKYARMMAWTHRDEYKRLEQSLPGIPPSAFALVDKIVAMQLAWQQEFAAAYPKLASRGRPISNSGAPLEGTSFEVYLRGELLTYSVPTLTLYANHLENLRKQGLNISIQSMEQRVRLSGYESLAQAEARLASI